MHEYAVFIVLYWSSSCVCCFGLITVLLGWGFRGVGGGGGVWVGVGRIICRVKVVGKR